MANEAFALSPISARATFAGRGGLCRDQRSLHGDVAGPLVSRPNTPSATAMPTPAWCSMRWRGSSRVLPPRRTKALPRSARPRRPQRIAAAETSRNEAKLAEARLAEARLAEAGLAEARLAEARLAEARLAEARLAEAMAAIRHAVEAAQASAIEALDGLALNEQLAPVRKGARVLREIAWRLREIGNDGRICDLIDSQVSRHREGRRADHLRRGQGRGQGCTRRRLRLDRWTAGGVQRRRDAGTGRRGAIRLACPGPAGSPCCDRTRTSSRKLVRLRTAPFRLIP